MPACLHMRHVLQSAPPPTSSKSIAVVLILLLVYDTDTDTVDTGGDCVSVSYGNLSIFQNTQYHQHPHQKTLGSEARREDTEEHDDDDASTRVYNGPMEGLGDSKVQQRKETKEGRVGSVDFDYY